MVLLDRRADNEDRFRLTGFNLKPQSQIINHKLLSRYAVAPEDMVLLDRCADNEDRFRLTGLLRP